MKKPGNYTIIPPAATWTIFNYNNYSRKLPRKNYLENKYFDNCSNLEDTSYNNCKSLHYIRSFKKQKHERQTNITTTAT